MEDLETELEQFIYLASHDLQEPIRKIIGYAELLEKDLETEDEDRIKEDLHYIVDSAERMQSMIQSLLKLSRIDRDDFEPRTVDPEDCVESAMNNLEFLIEEHNPELSVESLPFVRAEEEGLIHVYQNLIENALKYNDSDPAKIIFTGDTDGDQAILGVADNGIGIEEEYRDQVFTPFKRLQSRSTHEGEGFGLSIVQKIIDRLDGEVWIDDGIDGGTHFKFSLSEAKNDDE